MASAIGPPGAGGPSLAILRNHRLVWSLIAGGLILLVIVAFIGFTGAYFTSTSRSPGNEYVAAGMGLDLAETGQIVQGDGMLPGDVRSGSQTVTNTGHAGLLVLRGQGIDATKPLAKVLRVAIRQTDPALPSPVYDGVLAQLGTIDLGKLEKGARRSFAFTVTWPAVANSPDLSGQSLSLAFDWRLESVP